jgi:hypothetical protein
MRALVLHARWLLSALLLAGAALFVVGVAVERSGDDHDDEFVAVSSEGAVEAEHDEAADAGAQAEEPDHDEAAEEERVRGLDLESTPLVIAAVIVSVALAIGV